MHRLHSEDVIAALDDSGSRLLRLTELEAGFEAFLRRCESNFSVCKAQECASCQ